MWKFFRQNRGLKEHTVAHFGWWVEAPRDFNAFILNLREVTPENAVLCLEGAKLSPKLKSALQKYETAVDCYVEKDTVFPPADQLFLTVTQECLCAVLRETGASHAREIFTHMKVIAGNELFMWWHDADFDNGMGFSSSLSKEKVQQFVKKIGSCFQSTE